ncbi:uncharacterized protein [Dysidea avara]|uniref:uncharacterized protein n=1 Tax=Dysidea avara TaxID=196820 RepID=UPI0033269708
MKIGACLAMGKLKAFEAIQALRYLMRVDFDPVKEAAKQALTELDAFTDGAPVMDNSSPYTGHVKLATSRLSQANLEDGQVQTQPAATTSSNDTPTDCSTGITRSESTYSNPTSCI